MKDHQIAALVNRIRDALCAASPIFKLYGPLRGVISSAVVEYLSKEGLKVNE